MGPRQHVSREETIVPVITSSGGVENEIPFRTRVNSCCQMCGTVCSVEDVAFGDDFEAGNLPGVAMKFPTEQAWDKIALFHSGNL